MDPGKIISLQRRLGVTFADVTWLEEALKPGGINAGMNQKHKRLELVGDSVLSTVIHRWLLNEPYLTVGWQTERHGVLVSNRIIAQCSRRLGLPDDQTLTKLQRQALRTAGEATLTKRAANLLEAVIGAIFCDQGYEAAERFILEIALPHFEEASARVAIVNPKALLQEYLELQRDISPRYVVVEQNLQAVKNRYTVACMLGDEELGRQRAVNRDLAEHRLAVRLLRELYNVVSTASV